MKISSISDVHVVKDDDDRARVLLSFLNNSKVLNSDVVIFLGDVFDCFVGGNKVQLRDYQSILESIENILLLGKTFYFIEGNHDFHVGELLQNRFSKFDNFIYKKNGIIISNDNRKIFYCHGDDIEIGNPRYQTFRKLIRSEFVNHFFTILCSSNYLSKIKRKIASKSIKYFGEYSKKEEDFLREKFRGSAQLISERFNFDAVVCGHSHIKDHLVGEKYDYINNGFSRVTKVFVFFEDGKFNLESLV